MVLTQTEYARGAGAFDKAIAIDVGPEKRRFHLHTKLIAEDSEFFKAATEPRWDVPGREALDLSDEDPSVFKIFAIWLYGRFIAIEVGTLKGRERIDHVDSILIKAYSFAQRRLSSRFHDAIISAFTERLRADTCETLSAINMSFLFNETSEGSALRRLMIEYTIWLSSNNEDMPPEDCQHPEFLTELSKAQALFIRQHTRSRRAPSDPTYDICKYHQHDEGDEKEICNLHEPHFYCGNEGYQYPACGMLKELTAGLEAKTFHTEDSLFVTQSSTPKTKPWYYSHLDSAAIELLLQFIHLHWSLTDVVHIVHEHGSREKNDAVLMQLTHLYYIGVDGRNCRLLNETTDAIVEWSSIYRQAPSVQCLSFAYDYAVQTENSDEGNKLLHLLVLLLAWNGDYTLCENVRVLQILAMAQSSLRDTRAHMSRGQRRMPQGFYKEDSYVRKHFHRHLDDEPVCYSENSLWSEFFDHIFQERLKKLPCRSVLHEKSHGDAADAAQNDVDGSDEHRHKRPRTT